MSSICGTDHTRRDWPDDEVGNPAHSRAVSVSPVGRSLHYTFVPVNAREVFRAFAVNRTGGGALSYRDGRVWTAPRSRSSVRIENSLEL